MSACKCHGILAPFRAKVMVMRYITIILFALVCAACSSALPSLKPYRMDIQQGNVVTSKMMLQLRPGMTKSQVRFIMGTPLIQDSFHANRWDYFYEMRKDGRIIERRRVIMEFEDDKLARVRGDVIPAGTGEGEAAEPTAGTAPVMPAKKSKKERSLMDRLKFWKDDDAQETPQEVPAELIGPAAKPAEAKPVVPAEKPAPQPAIEGAAPEGIREPTIEPAPERQEGMPEPGAPLGPDPEHVERGAAPTVEAPQAQEIDDSAPRVAPAEPAPVETAPAEPAAAPVPAPQAEPAPRQEAPAKPEPVVQPQPAETRQQAPQRKVAPQPEPEPQDDDLPPEDDPGYFERMLEKIGF
jgi:outer membrane protein assembly factor BamE